MSFNIRDIDPDYVKKFGGHYNRCEPRDRQGQTRAKKTNGQYRPTGKRASQDEPKRGPSQ